STSFAAPKQKVKGAAEPPSAAPARDPNAVDYEVVTRIRQEAFRDSTVMDTLHELTDNLGPRLTNSPNQKRASDWVRGQLQKWGVENVHFEAWGPFGPGWSYEVSHVRLVAPDTQEFIALPKAWSVSTNGVVHGKPMLVTLKSKGDLDKYRGKLKGAILFNGE